MAFSREKVYLFEFPRIRKPFGLQGSHRRDGSSKIYRETQRSNGRTASK